MDTHRRRACDAALSIGWDAIEREAWAEAARGFQEATAIDPKFALAYYSLGRAQMNNTSSPSDQGLSQVPRDLSRTRRRAILQSTGRKQGTGRSESSSTATTCQNVQRLGQRAAQVREQLTRMKQAREKICVDLIEISVHFFVPLRWGPPIPERAFRGCRTRVQVALDANPGLAKRKTISPWSI